MRLFYLLLFTCLLGLSCQTDKDKRLINFVDPFIGTGGHGHTFPGATVPFGMVQLSPDTRLEGWDGCSGYHYTDSIVYGFSHTHLSGTGVADYCDILLMPVAGNVHLQNGYKDGADSGYASRFSKSSEIASPGYYRVSLSDYDIDVELSSTHRAGLHKYRYRGNQETKAIVLDLNHRDPVIDASMEKTGPNEISGFRISSSWAREQHVYFVVQFNRNIDNIIYTTDKRVAGIFITPDENQEVLARVGISATSVEAAKENLENEIDHWDFSKVRLNAENLWEDQLSKILVEGGTEDQKTIFYTALYHCMIAPNLFSDVEGSYRSMDMSIRLDPDTPTYTVFSLWDTFRALHPLLNILEPERTNHFIQTFLKHYKEGGRLPVWELAANETECMIGYHSVPVIYDATQKGIEDFSKEEALSAMINSGDLDHFGLEAYKQFGYIPSDEFSESVSRTLEYSYDDWCIAKMAENLGKSDLASQFEKRSLSYRNLYDPNTGFIRAKSNGAWVDGFDPREVNFNFTEANAWQYSLFMPHDINGMIDMMGGEDLFEAHLDSLFNTSSETSGRDQADITGLIGQYAHGNEPSHHMAYLYNFVGKAFKTQERVRQILDELYTVKPDGLSGNEDCGQMSAWYVLSAMGFYSVTPGLNDYILGSPLFDKVIIQLPEGKSFTIISKNNSDKNKYIQSVMINGQVHNKSFFNYSEIKNGSTIEIDMGNKPNPSFGEEISHRPVSRVNDENFVPVPWVEAAQRSFLDSLEVQFASSCKNCQILYQQDEKGWQEYSVPLTIYDHSNFELYALDPSGNKSELVRSSFVKRDGDRSIQLFSEYANQYSAGGDEALIDYIRGGSDFRTGKWQGFQGQDLEFVVNLKSKKKFNTIKLGMLQDIQSWIWYPSKVEFFVSENGEDFRSVGVVENLFSDREYGSYTQELAVTGSFNAQYLKVVAMNYGNCPDWHLGAGGKSWIFVDELIIE